jgi:hypothetical protein
MGLCLPALCRGFVTGECPGTGREWQVGLGLVDLRRRGDDGAMSRQWSAKRHFSFDGRLRKKESAASRSGVGRGRGLGVVGGLETAATLSSATRCHQNVTERCLRRGESGEQCSDI